MLVAKLKKDISFALRRGTIAKSDYNPTLRDGLLS